MGLDKSECLRLKGITEPLEDIIKRHYGKDIDTLYYGARVKAEDYIEHIEHCLQFKDKDKELANFTLLMVALGIIKNVELDNWLALLHQNDKLDTGE